MDDPSKVDAFVSFGKLAETYGEQYQASGRRHRYPANQFRLRIVLDLLESLQPRRILDVGCGTGEPLIEIRKRGFHIEGFDYAEEMVEKARRNLESAGLPRNLVHHNNMEDIRGIAPGAYDCIIALGSVYYARDLDKTINNIVDLLPPGSSFIFSLRNDLFSLFSLNEYTVNFMWRHLIPAEALSKEAKLAVEKFLNDRCAEANVERKFQTVDDLNIHSVYHNPLTVENELLNPHGLTLEGRYYYHFHALPPIFEHTMPEEFRRVSMEMEDAGDWRGLFMSSAFIVHAGKPQ